MASSSSSRDPAATASTSTSGPLSVGALLVALLEPGSARDPEQFNESLELLHDLQVSLTKCGVDLRNPLRRLGPILTDIEGSLVQSVETKEASLMALYGLDHAVRPCLEGSALVEWESAVMRAVGHQLHQSSNDHDDTLSGDEAGGKGKEKAKEDGLAKGQRLWLEGCKQQRIAMRLLAFDNSPWAQYGDVEWRSAALSGSLSMQKAKAAAIRFVLHCANVNPRNPRPTARFSKLMFDKVIELAEKESQQGPAFNFKNLRAAILKLRSGYPNNDAKWGDPEPDFTFLRRPAKPVPSPIPPTVTDVALSPVRPAAPALARAADMGVASARASARSSTPQSRRLRGRAAARAADAAEHNADDDDDPSPLASKRVREKRAPALRDDGSSHKSDLFGAARRRAGHGNVERSAASSSSAASAASAASYAASPVARATPSTLLRRIDTGRYFTEHIRLLVARGDIKKGKKAIDPAVFEIRRGQLTPGDLGMLKQPDLINMLVGLDGRVSSASDDIARAMDDQHQRSELLEASLRKLKAQLHKLEAEKQLRAVAVEDKMQNMKAKTDKCFNERGHAFALLARNGLRLPVCDDSSSLVGWQDGAGQRWAECEGGKELVEQEARVEAPDGWPDDDDEHDDDARSLIDSDADLNSSPDMLSSSGGSRKSASTAAGRGEQMLEIEVEREGLDEHDGESEGWEWGGGEPLTPSAGDRLDLVQAAGSTAATAAVTSLRRINDTDAARLDSTRSGGVGSRARDRAARERDALEGCGAGGAGGTVREGGSARGGGGAGSTVGRSGTRAGRSAGADANGENFQASPTSARSGPHPDSPQRRKDKDRRAAAAAADRADAAAAAARRAPLPPSSLRVVYTRPPSSSPPAEASPPSALVSTATTTPTTSGPAVLAPPPTLIDNSYPIRPDLGLQELTLRNARLRDDAVRLRHEVDAAAEREVEQARREDELLERITYLEAALARGGTAGGTGEREGGGTGEAEHGAVAPVGGSAAAGAARRPAEGPSTPSRSRAGGRSGRTPVEVERGGGGAAESGEGGAPGPEPDAALAQRRQPMREAKTPRAARSAMQ